MRYVDCHGFIKNIYYQFTVVDLWTDSSGEGYVVPIFRINLLKPRNGGFAITVSIPWATVGLGLAKSVK